MDFEEKLRTGYYKNKLPYARVGRSTPPETTQEGREVHEIARAYKAEEQRLHAEFRADLEAEHNVTKNPKRDLLFAKAWDMGHSSGFSEVANHYADLVELIR